MVVFVTCCFELDFRAEADLSLLEARPKFRDCLPRLALVRVSRLEAVGLYDGSIDMVDTSDEEGDGGEEDDDRKDRFCLFLFTEQKRLYNIIRIMKQ